jgi:ABC-2 type transport system permease protein
MRRAVFNVMFLSLLRDPAALILVFFLPPAVFCVFAAIFSAAAEGEIVVSVGYLNKGGDHNRVIIERLQSSPSVSFLKRIEDQAKLSNAVRRGRLDVGVEFLASEENPAPRFRLYIEQSRVGAATLTESALSMALIPLAQNRVNIFERVVVAGDRTAPPMAAYYAAGVIMLFLFLSGLQTALSLIDERDLGILERVAAGPIGIRGLIDGKFVFLIVQGLTQAVLILAAAAVFFDVRVFDRPIELIGALVVSAITAAGLALAIVAMCRSREQAHALGTAIVLVMAALGGSMAPRFLMPPEIQTLGALTPTAWGIDALSAALWRGGGLDLITLPFALLITAGFFGVILAHAGARRSLRADR